MFGNSDKKKQRMVEDTTNKIKEMNAMQSGIVRDMSSFNDNNIATLDKDKLNKTHHRVDKAYREMKKLNEELAGR